MTFNQNTINNRDLTFEVFDTINYQPVKSLWRNILLHKNIHVSIDRVLEHNVPCTCVVWILWQPSWLWRACMQLAWPKVHHAREDLVARHISQHCCTCCTGLGMLCICKKKYMENFRRFSSNPPIEVVAECPSSVRRGRSKRPIIALICSNSIPGCPGSFWKLIKHLCWTLGRWISNIKILEYLAK